MTTTRNRPARPGFTLIEILVAMSLIILLAALALGVSQTGMFGSQKVISAGDRASGWLLIAKQRAMRDGLPRGVRFFNTVGGATGNPNAFTEAAYIEQPDAWVPNQHQEGNPGGARIVFSIQWWKSPVPGKPNIVSSTEPTWVTAPGPTQGDPVRSTLKQPKCYYISSVLADMDEFDQRLIVPSPPGSGTDLLVLPEFGKSFRVASIINPVTETVTIAGVVIPPANLRELVFLNPVGPNFEFGPDFSAAGTEHPRSVNTTNPVSHPVSLTTYKFGFQRPAQPLLGEPALQLTGGTGIDFRFPIDAATLTQPVEPAFPLLPGGYRTWNTPTPAVVGVPNAGPFNPPTTTGITAQADLATGGSFIDILFSPSGQVLNNNAGVVCLWVRETSKVPHPRQTDPATRADCDPVLANDAAGPQVLIVLNTRNGLISTQPIVPPPAAASVSYDPYFFAKDGVNSGL